MPPHLTGRPVWRHAESIDVREFRRYLEGRTLLDPLCSHVLTSGRSSRLGRGKSGPRADIPRVLAGRSAEPGPGCIFVRLADRKGETVETWGTLAVIRGSAAAALVGLLFVALSIRLDMVVAS
jgi:hypothetical protein